MAGDVPQSMDSSSLSVAKYVPALAPVLLVAIGYMDPGNWACAIEGGSRFGFELLWVVIVSNVMAALFQTLATRLGLVSGKHLAEVQKLSHISSKFYSFWLDKCGADCHLCYFSFLLRRSFRQSIGVGKFTVSTCTLFTR